VGAKGAAAAVDQEQADQIANPLTPSEGIQTSKGAVNDAITAPK
jgi:hypothetical protein